MAQINTRIVLRNDSTINWNANLDQVLFKGELGIEFLDSGKAKVKIGDGVKTWQELEYFGGEEVLGDGKSVKVANGEICLVGFDAAEVGAQPRKNADGLIEWVVPSTETVEGLQSAVAGLQSDVTNLQTNVTVLQEIIMPSGEGELPLLSRVETLEIKMDGDGEGSVNARIAAAINDFAGKISDDGTINTFKELVDYVSEHGNEVAGILTELDKKVDKVEGMGLSSNDFSDSLLAKLEGIEEGAQVNVIESITMGGTILDIINKVVDIPMAGLDTFGVVKSSVDVNKVNVAEDGTMEVNSVNVNKLVQNEGDWMILNGGDSSL